MNPSQLTLPGHMPVGVHATEASALAGQAPPDDLASWLESQAKALEPVLTDALADAALRDQVLERMQALRQEAALWRVRQVALGVEGAQPALGSLGQATAQAQEVVRSLSAWQARLDAVGLLLQWAAAWRAGHVEEGLAALSALKAMR